MLLVAAVGGNKEAASLLLRNGACMDQRDKDGKTALMIAVVNGHQGLVELLLEKGADLSIKNEVCVCHEDHYNLCAECLRPKGIGFLGLYVC